MELLIPLNRSNIVVTFQLLVFCLLFPFLFVSPFFSIPWDWNNIFWQPFTPYVFIFAGLSTIMKKLNVLLPILVGCFQDFIPLVHSMPQLDAQSFDCMLSVLQSIDLVIKFFIYGIDKSQQELQVSLPSYSSTDATLWGQNISPVFLKKLWDVFPLNPTHHLSEKVRSVYNLGH